MSIAMLDKNRAKAAWDRVREVAAMDDAKIQKRYRSQTRGGMAMIQRNGLGQFLTFLASSGFEKGKIVDKKKPSDHADGLLYQHLGAWLLETVCKIANANQESKKVAPGSGTKSDPLDFLLDPNTTLEQTMWATREAIAFLQWSRRFAESQLSQPDED